MARLWLVIFIVLLCSSYFKTVKCYKINVDNGENSFNVCPPSLGRNVNRRFLNVSYFKSDNKTPRLFCRNAPSSANTGVLSSAPVRESFNKTLSSVHDLNLENDTKKHSDGNFSVSNRNKFNNASQQIDFETANNCCKALFNHSLTTENNLNHIVGYPCSNDSVNETYVHKEYVSLLPGSSNKKGNLLSTNDNSCNKGSYIFGRYNVTGSHYMNHSERNMKQVERNIIRTAMINNISNDILQKKSNLMRHENDLSTANDTIVDLMKEHLLRNKSENVEPQHDIQCWKSSGTKIDNSSILSLNNKASGMKYASLENPILEALFIISKLCCIEPNCQKDIHESFKTKRFYPNNGRKISDHNSFNSFNEGDKNELTESREYLGNKNLSNNYLSKECSNNKFMDNKTKINNDYLNINNDFTPYIGQNVPSSPQSERERLLRSFISALSGKEVYKERSHGNKRKLMNDIDSGRQYTYKPDKIYANIKTDALENNRFPLWDVDKTSKPSKLDQMISKDINVSRYGERPYSNRGSQILSEIKSYTYPGKASYKENDQTSKSDRINDLLEELLSLLKQRGDHMQKQKEDYQLPPKEDDYFLADSPVFSNFQEASYTSDLRGSKIAHLDDVWNKYLISQRQNKIGKRKNYCHFNRFNYGMFDSNYNGGLAQYRLGNVNRRKNYYNGARDFYNFNIRGRDSVSGYSDSKKRK